jgi:hypothetical protein
MRACEFILEADKTISDPMQNLVDIDQQERNEYKKFVQDQAKGDWEKGAKLYSQLKNRPSDDVFGEKERQTQFQNMQHNFNKFTTKDWKNYWLLSQHADNNVDFQKQALTNIEKYRGQDNEHYRYLHDRIAVNTGQPQKYGTQNVPSPKLEYTSLGIKLMRAKDFVIEFYDDRKGADGKGISKIVDSFTQTGEAAGFARLKEGVVGRLKYGSILFVIDDHAIHRTAERDVDPHAVDRVLKRLATKPELVDSIDSGQQFWIYSADDDTAVGLRRLMQDRPEFKVKTTLPHRPRTPGILIDL